MKTTPHKHDNEPLVIAFDDNSLLTALFGGHDQHLALIEQRLGVSVSYRGNRVVIAGEDIDTVLAETEDEVNAILQRVKTEF